MTEDALLADQLDQWNNLANELARLYAEYRDAPRAYETADVSCDVFNAVNWRAREMTYALVSPRPERPNEVGEHVWALREQVELIRSALERDLMLPGPRNGLGGLDGPDLRLLTAVREVREAYRARRHKGPIVTHPAETPP